MYLPGKHKYNEGEKYIQLVGNFSDLPNSDLMQNCLKLHFFHHAWEGEEKQKTNLPILNIVLFLTINSIGLHRF